MVTRKEAIARIRTALRARSGRSWSVTGSTGTAYGWITVSSLPRQRADHDYMTFEDCETLGLLMGQRDPAHCQGISISPDHRELYVDFAEGRRAMDGRPVWTKQDAAIAMDAAEGQGRR